MTHFAIPADRFALAWASVWPASKGGTLDRTVIIERYDNPDVCHLWATDGSLLLSALACGFGVSFTPELWDEVTETAPVEQVVAYDELGHGMVVAKAAATMAKDDPDLDVTLTIGRRAPSSSTPTLAPELEALQAVVAVEGITVEMVAIEKTPPDWRALWPGADAGARVKGIRFGTQRLKRLASVPAAGDVRLRFRSATGAVTALYSTGGEDLPVRGLLMPIAPRSEDLEVVS